MKPYYERNGIIIYVGECSKVLATFPPNHFALTITSPPYDDLREYQGYVFDFDAIGGQLWRVTDKGGVVVWVVGDQTKDGSESGTSFRQALGFMGLGFKLHDTMVWEKICPYQHKNRYIQAFEYMFILSKGRRQKANLIADRKNKWAGTQIHGTARQPSGEIKPLSIVQKSKQVKELGVRYNIWDLAPEKNNQTGHPAPFPEALARDHIISWSNPGDLVLDPMAGSGTVGKMALELGRRCVLIDISEEYCRIAVDRLRQPSFWSIGKKQAPEKTRQVGLEEMIKRGLE